MFMGISERFISGVTINHLFSTKDKLLLAVSGGVDSVVLCELCKQAGYDFVIAHCNFQLRGEESERDEQFVRELSAKYGVEVLVKKFETEKFATESKLSIQEAARKLRYDWFEELVISREPGVVSQNTGAVNKNPEGQRHCKVYLLTAHHRDDNTETVLMNFFRGTGLHGLTGIPEKINYIRRPLLSFSKEELIDFAKENKLDYVEDSSNQSSKYTRNFFRNELIPAISNVYPKAKENLQDNIARFNEIEKLYKIAVGEIKKKLCRIKGHEVHIPVKQLMGYNNSALIYEIISSFGFGEKQVDELIKLAGSESGHYIESPGGNYRIIRHRHWFIISPARVGESVNIIIDEGVKNLEFGTGRLVIQDAPVSQIKISNSPDIACLDKKNIRFPLLLRKWKTGDYFYPLGMKKKKKIARFLIDLRLSKTEKENVWVLESNKHILWVVGYRIDERFKIAANTRDVMQFTLSK